MCYTTRDNPALDSARREFPEEPTRSPYPCCPPLSRHAPPPPHAPPPQRVSARACRCVRDQHPRGLGGSTRQRALGSGERCMGFGDGPAGGAHTGVTGVWVLGGGGWGGWYWCSGNSIRATGTDGSARQQSTYCGPRVRLSPAYCAYTPHTSLQPALLLTPPSSLCTFTFWRPPLLSSLLLQAHRPRITATSHLEFRCRSHILPRCLATDLTAVGPAFVQPCCYNRAVLFGGTSDDALAAQHAAPG